MKFSLKYRGVGHYVLLFCINSTSGYTCSYPMIVNGWPQSHHKSMSGFFSKRNLTQTTVLRKW